MGKLVKYYNGNLIEYDILKLVDFYDPILRQPTIPWIHKDHAPKDCEYLAFSMVETLKELGGIGLSANQVGLRHRICVINMGDEIWTMFNPVIVDHGMTPSRYSEGCLSYPGLYLKVPRYDHIKVRFQATYGQDIEQEFDGLTAVCVQHEIDHLNGIMYTDRISPIKLEQAKRKVKKNLKNMKKFQMQQDALDSQQEMKVEKPLPSPTINILDAPIDIQDNKPKAFVYSTG
jgi:peptide deformylase